MASDISTIRGMTSELAGKLNANGVHTTADLLTATETPAGRRQLAAACGVEDSALTEWINRADLERIKGVAGAFANLLEEAGVDSVKELARRKAENLHAKLVALNAEQKIAHHVPPLETVTAWIEEAQKLSQAPSG